MLALALLLAVLPDPLAADSLAPRPAVLSAAASAEWAGAPLSVRLPEAFGERAEALPVAPGRGVPAGVSAGVAGGTAVLGSVAGGVGGALAFGLSSISGSRSVSDDPPPLAYGFVAVGAVVGAVASIA